MGNLIKHCKLHGTNELESDAARLELLTVQIADLLDEFEEINQRFNWCDDLSEPRKNVGLNLLDVLMSLELTCSNYRSSLDIARAASLMRGAVAGETSESDTLQA